MAKAARSNEMTDEPTGRDLKRAYETYLAHLPRLAHQECRFVLIHDTDVVDVYDTYNAALSAGYEKFGVDKPFLVKRVSSVESPVIVR